MNGHDQQRMHERQKRADALAKILSEMTGHSVTATTRMMGVTNFVFGPDPKNHMLVGALSMDEEETATIIKRLRKAAPPAAGPRGRGR